MVGSTVALDIFEDSSFKNDSLSLPYCAEVKESAKSALASPAELCK